MTFLNQVVTRTEILDQKSVTTERTSNIKYKKYSEVRGS